MPHDDFSFLTGKQADLDNDGTVSFGEYMNEEDDYSRIMGGSDDYTVLDDDDDLEDEYSGEEYSDFKYDADEDGGSYLPSDFDTSKPTLTIGPKIGLMYLTKCLQDAINWK